MTRVIVEKLENKEYKHCLSVVGSDYTPLKTVWDSVKSWFIHGDFRVYKQGEYEKAEYFSE